MNISESTDVALVLQHMIGATNTDREPQDVEDAAVRLTVRVGQPWVDDALCAQTDPEAFFPEKGGSTRVAKATCAKCFVQAECLDWALTTHEGFGIWGGLSERERRAISAGTTTACPDCGEIFYNPSGYLSHQRTQHRPPLGRTAS